MKEFVIKEGILHEYHGEDEEVYIPEGVEEVGFGVFAGNQTIQKVVIPEGVTILHPRCFKSCEQLEEVQLPTGLKSIGPEAFSLCRCLKEIHIPDSVEAMGEQVFGMTKYPWGSADQDLNPGEGLQEVILPKLLKEIPADAFNNQTNLKHVVWPDQLEIIHTRAFAYCKNLQIDSFPETLKGIELEALETVQIHPGVSFPLEYVGDYHLYPWAQGEEVIVPEGVHTIGKMCFYDNKTLKKVDLTAVSKIEPHAFAFCENLEEVICSDQLQTIENDAFRNCQSLSSITLPDSMEPTGLGAEVFRGCTSLQQVILPAHLRIIKNGTFAQCTSLEQMTIPADVQEIGEKTTSEHFTGAFEGCSSLHTIHFEAAPHNEPLSLSLHSGVFRSCTALTEIHLPMSCTCLGASCFEGCSNLESLQIPASVEWIGNNCFRNASALKQLDLPESLEVLKYAVFCGCSLLKSITVPKKTKIIGGCAFGQCQSLETVELLGSTYSKRPEKDRWGRDADLGNRLFSSSPNLKTVKYMAKELDEFAFEEAVPDLTLIAPNVRFSEVETAALKPMLCRGYAVLKDEGKSIPEEVQAEYHKYLKSRRKSFLPELPDNLLLLRVMIQNKLLTKDQVTELLNHETIASQPEIAAFIDTYYNAKKAAKKKKEALAAVPKKVPLDPDQLRDKLFSAVQEQDISALEQISSQYEFPKDLSATVQIISRGGRFSKEKKKTLLDCAVEQGHLPSVQTIIKNIPVANMESGLGLAIEKQWIEAVESILAGKVIPAKETVMNSTLNRESALETALRTGNQTILDLIFSKTPKISDTVLVKSFKTAVGQQDFDSARKLLERANKIKDETHNYLLETAIQCGDRHLIDQLLDQDNHPILPHSLAMAYALRKGDIETVRKLKQNKVSIRSSESYLELSNKTSFEKRRCFYNDYQSIADDDFKAVFTRAGESIWSYPYWALFEMFEGRNDRFSELYKEIPRMEEPEMAQFLCELADQKICTQKEMEYFWFLAVAADFIQAAESLEEKGFLAKDWLEMKERAGISRKMDTFADLAVPGMSARKASYILEHMNPDEPLNWGKSYFAGNLYNLRLFVELTGKFGNERFRLTDKKHAVETCIEAKYLEGVKKLTEFSAINSRNIKGFIDQAEEQQDVELKMWLLNYQNEHLKPAAQELTL